MKGVKTEKTTGPMSGSGIMRFFDVSGGGPKISPEVVIGLSVATIVLVILGTALL